MVRSRAELLAEINADLPDLDWKKGAEDYVAGFYERFTPAQIDEFIFTKPLANITPEDPAGSLAEVCSYLFNFASAIRLLSLKRGARILDVACGGGWFSHWLRKIGYEAIGLDISEDFVRLARRRLQLDPHLTVSDHECELAYRRHDLELTRLPEDLLGTFDVVVLESCLHHFFDPVMALTHIAEGLAPDGVVLILEGENRKGPLKEEYLQVMRETETLERPYERSQLIELLDFVGLKHVEFLGSVPGFFPQSASLSRHMTEYLADSTEGSNVCVCAPTAEALRRIVPSYGSAPTPQEPTPQAPPAQAPPEAPAPSEPIAVAPEPAPARSSRGIRLRPRRALRAGWRALLERDS